MAEALEIARVRLRPGAEEAFVGERGEMLRALVDRFPGLREATLARLDGSWVDVIRWGSRDEAEAAAAGVFDVPECVAWFGHIEEVLSMEHAEVAVG